MFPAKQSTRLMLWVLVCCLTAASTRASQPDIDKYLTTLNSLDKAKPESVCVARDSLRDLLHDTAPPESTEPFRAFRRFYLDSVNNTIQAFQRIMDGYIGEYEKWADTSPKGAPMEAFLQTRPDIAKAGSRWFQCGFSMYDGEGDFYPVPDSSTLLSFADKLSPGLASYIQFRAREDREDVIGDASLQLTWEQLRARLARWETFGREHPALPETHLELEPAVRILAKLYVFGSDNTPMFDPKTSALDPTLVASWRLFAAQDITSRYQPLIAALLEKLDRQDQKLSEANRPLFERFGLGQEFDMWWNLVQLRLSGR